MVPRLGGPRSSHLDHVTQFDGPGCASYARLKRAMKALPEISKRRRMSKVRRATCCGLLLVAFVLLVVQRFFLFGFSAWADVLLVGLGAACVLGASWLGSR